MEGVWVWTRCQQMQKLTEKDLEGPGVSPSAEMGENAKGNTRKKTCSHASSTRREKPPSLKREEKSAKHKT